MSRSWLILPLLILYLLDLGGAGFLGPDEPRYASIGREMARSHDFITPRLDGKPWFEKPPLLYWMIAGGRALRLPDEWAARLPVALLSVALVLFLYWTIAREFSPRTAMAAAAILATSAGWLGYSSVAVTDLPMTATFTAAMLVALFETRRAHGYAAGALLGLSVLAKGFVPLVLFLPMFLVARGKRLAMLGGCAVVAAPWYVWCAARNGPAFWQEFFWKHHVARFFSGALEHVQPFWYYVPVLLAGLFPWTPLAGLLIRKKIYQDVRVRFLLVWIAYALIFFSVAKNKLPGYALPLLPALAIVFAAALEKAGAAAKWWLAASVLMLAAAPAVAAALPAGLLSGVRRAPMVLTPGIPFLAGAAIVWWLSWRERPNLAMFAAAMTVLFAVAYVKGKTVPDLDRSVSVRAFWRANQQQSSGACVENIRRDWLYGLNYYAERELPTCQPGDSGPRIAQENGRLVFMPR